MTHWLEVSAPAKVNLALVVGPTRADGKHEVVTVLERLELVDTLAVCEADATTVDGFADDTLIRAALDAVCAASGTRRRFAARVVKRIPVAAGLGGGSSDAAAALALANRLVESPLSSDRLHALASELGADVPFFLRDGPQLATGDGTTLEPVELPRDYAVLLALPEGVTKASTREVYRAFDERDGARGFEERRAALRGALAGVRSVPDLATLPANDLASSPLAAQFSTLGALRADVSGAGPAVYGLFSSTEGAERAAQALGTVARVCVTRPAGSQGPATVTA
jgi:4-diphosphocytidyl-2-C-methyl-D-erythritol kinase